MPLLIDKPLGYTSHDVVARLRGALHERRIGHAGTLDPLATGLLIILVGRAETKLQDHYLHMDKSYVVTGKLGATTPTYDAEGEVQPGGPWEQLTTQDITEQLKKFTGIIQQTVPAFSAVKVQGKKLYQLARQAQSSGAVINQPLPQRTVEIKQLVLLDYKPPYVTLEIHCTSGTYIRSLVHDLGQALGCGAYVTALRRTRIGEFRVEDAKQLADVL